MMLKTAHPRRRAAVAILAAIAPIAAILTVVAVPTANASAVPGPPAGWTTVFSDDFSGAAGTGVSTANWLYDTGTSYPGGAGNWGTGEVESETTSTANVYQDGNGHLVIKPIRDAAGNWTSGRIETQNTGFAAPPGGQMEMTASIEQPNPGNGLGYWPAFWAMGSAARGVGATNWPSIGEFDIMEDVNALSQVSHTFHCGVDPGGPCNETNGISSNLLACGGCQTGYHTYSIIVDRTNTSAEQLRFYTDGNLQWTVNENQVPVATWQAAVDHGFFMILNVAIGGAYPNRICNCTTPTTATGSGAGMSVGYVAVYETGSGVTTPPTTNPPSTTPPTTTPPGGTQCTTTATSNISADCFSSSQGSAPVSAAGDTNPTGVDANQVAQLSSGSWLEYPGVNFGTGSSQFDARAASGAAGGVSGLVNVVLDNPSNTPIGTFAIGNTGGWTSWRTIPANITTTTGTHNVYLEFQSGAGGNPPYVSLHYFSFPAH
ncbi:carbohydrate-binding protein [Actinospica sp.]|uniref:carbohydrate-binding protein n=1 Tax=Actinospica sp. TaxID=1872142 RepID=UPI002BF5E9C5|nr:carbohydrate-binding protein [Actinospica sp.]HWG25069.1 carbohydrate-binding protein [Actinospica sp.]